MKNTDKDVYVTVRISKELYDEIKGIAERNTRSLSAQVLHFTKRCVAISKTRREEQND